MKSNDMPMLRPSVLAVITIVAALVVTLFAGAPASAARSSAGPVYDTYSQCDRARKAYNSSWTRTSTCYAQPWYQNGQRFFKGYSFTIYYRY